MREAAKGSPAPDTVLIVESDEQVRRALQGVLTRQGYRTIATGSTDEALEMARKTSPASSTAILLADRVPAAEVTSFLRALDDADLNSAVIITAGAGPMDRVFETFRLGVVDFLRKPLGPEGLMTAVSRAVSIATKWREGREENGGRRAKTAVADTPVEGSEPTVTALPALAVLPALAAVLRAFDAGAIQIPAVPAVVNELRRAIRDPKTSLDGLAVLIQRDQGLALSVLRMSNSATFARGARNSDLKTAVGRIGFQQIEALTETVFLHGCYQPRDVRFQAVLGDVWRHSVAMAISMRLLAENLGRGTRLDPCVAYLAGLLSDVGASFLMGLISERVPGLDPSVAFAVVAERHESVGAQILTKWDVDPAVVQFSSSHHAQSPPTGTSLYWPLAAVATELVDRMAGSRDVTRRTRRGTAFVGRCAEELRLSEALLRKTSDQLDVEFQSVIDAMA
jgi:putative nucleotidyltransferase with HDIG domain